MKNFLRAARLTLQYKWTLFGLVFSTIAIALFWGGNIGAMYPIVEVAFQGKSLQEWVDSEIEKAETKSAELQESIQELRDSLDTMDEYARAQAENEIALSQDRMQAEQLALSWAKWLRPKIYKYLPDNPFQTIVVIVTLLMIGTAIKNVFIFTNHMHLQRLTQLIGFDLRRQMYHHSLRMDLSEFGAQRTGEMMSRFNVDLGILCQGLNSIFGRAFLEPLKGLACLVGAGIICWRLLLFSLFLTPVAAILIRLLAGSIKRANRRAMEENTQLMGVLSEAFGGMQTVKAFTMEQYERTRFRRISKEYLRKGMKIAFYNALTRPATEVLGLGVIFVALLAGAYLVLNQETHLWGIKMCERPMSVAALLCFYGLLVGASDPARKLSSVFNAIQGGIAAADRIYPILDRQPKISDPENAREAPRPHRMLVFDNVHFHYTPDKKILRGINFDVKFGETICIVGQNGCGKSTLANLLPRFYDPVEGAVRLDDIDLRELRLKDLRRVVGMVTQQTLLFDDTVINNIRYGSLNATKEEVIQAARRAHAHSFIENKLPNGYETCVGPGGNRLSGGQRQRIALARAILRDPDILILDEATSQIDIESEQAIHHALAEFVCDRTAIIITHRLSTLELADRILVMEAGRIADLGTHDELIVRCDLYRRLHDIQLRQSA